MNGAHRPAATWLHRWSLRPDGPPRRGAVALVVPVRCDDGTPAMLKLQPVDEETAGEPAALRAWDGAGAVRLLACDPTTGTMLLERLDPHRTLSGVPDDRQALQTLSQLLARLVSVPAPPGIRRLQDIAERMLGQVPWCLAQLAGPDDRRLVDTLATTVADVLPVRGHQLLHWDLHYDNVLGGTREPWLAIDPKPLAGEPGFELLPALRNRWPEVRASNDAAATVRGRFDLMVEVLGIDPRRAAAWTLGRVLQNVLWDVEDGSHGINPVLATVAGALRGYTT